jgi:predicted HNH restriction endonuclease
MNKEQYELVVKTDCWKLRREAYLKKNTWCEICGQSSAAVRFDKFWLEVHHLTYERIGDELDSDLMAVCNRCHALLHGLPGGTSTRMALGYLQYQSESPKRKTIIAKLLKSRAVMEGQAQ